MKVKEIVAWALLVVMATALAVTAGEASTESLDDVYLFPGVGSYSYCPGYGYIMLSSGGTYDCTLTWGNGMSYKVGLYCWQDARVEGTLVYPVYQGTTTAGTATHAGWYSFAFVNQISGGSGYIAVGWEP